MDVAEVNKHHTIVIKVADMNHAWCKRLWCMPHYCLLALLLSNLVQCTLFINLSTHTDEMLLMWERQHNSLFFDAYSNDSVSELFLHYISVQSMSCKMMPNMTKRSIKRILYVLRGNVSLHRCASGNVHIKAFPGMARWWWSVFTIHFKESFMLV